MDIKVTANELTSSNLFSTPSYLKGVARIVDIFGQLDEFNYSQSETIADQEAIKHDWEMVGENLYAALKEYEQKQKAATHRSTI